MNEPIAQSRRLFTWMDVEDQLAAQLRAGFWPDWLDEVSGFWDSLDLTVNAQVSLAAVRTWLTESLGPGVTIENDGKLLVRLETLDGESPEDLVVEIHEVGRPNFFRAPKWRDRRLTRASFDPLPVPEEALGLPLYAFHSYKGGVGRTTHAVSYALALAKRMKVLLVDGDLEAPGISWMFVSAGRAADFAYQDFLSLLHGAGSDRSDEPARVAAKFLANQELDGIFVMPSRRDLRSILPSRVIPPDLATSSRDPYLLATELVNLGKKLGVGAVVLDLRAGASEISSSMLLDPRVNRVFVSTASAQSLSGTEALISEIANRAPSRSIDHPVPRAIITQYHPATSEDALAELAAPLAAELFASVKLEEGQIELDADVSAFDPTFTPFREGLLNLPSSWDAVASVLSSSGLVESLANVLDAPSPVELPSEAAPIDRRAALANFASTLAFAETTDTQSFLATHALRSLTSSSRTELPICVVTGAKGAGKTFTQLQMVYRRDWAAYAAATGVMDVRISAPIVPVLASRNLQDDVAAQIQAMRSSAAVGPRPAQSLEIIDALKDALDQEASDRQWRRIWAWTLARSLGIEVGPESAEDALVEAAADGATNLFVMDGLEDVFQDVNTDPKQQAALRVLLQDTLEWLRSIRNRPFGIVVFVRRDLVRNAFSQNSSQFLSRYQAFELAWDETEAVRLAAWVCSSAEVILSSAQQIAEASDPELTDLMLPVWGDKMGTPRSREARSRGWFIAALSDFNGAIQARDIVLFMAEAAKESISDERWRDRILAPAAMRTALVACSAQKISAIGEETPRIKSLLDHLSGLDDSLRQVPITRDDLALDLEDVRLLEANGVVFREEDRYWIPEIFRQGLGFKAVGRPRIVAVANLVRKRNNIE